MRRISASLKKTNLFFYCILLLLLAFKLLATKNTTTGRKSNTVVYVKSFPVSLSNVHNKVIYGLAIDNYNGDCIKLSNCYNIEIKNCRFTSPNGIGIDIYQCKNVTVSNCYFERVVTGVYALNCTGIKVIGNRAKNILGPFPRGQMVQFDHVFGQGNRVNFNRCENIPGESNPEDVINMFETNGAVTDPVQIIGNWIRGGGPSKSGGGIMLGDKGGSFMTAENNILVNPGQYGIAIAGGTNIKIVKNVVFSSTKRYSNVGIYVWKQNKTACSILTVEGNRVNWTNSRGSPNNNWNNGNCGYVSGWQSNVWNANIDSTILPVDILEH